MIIPINANVLYINGYPDGTFLPDKVMTRAEAITVVSKLCGLTDKTSVIEKSSFTDVTESDWFARNVKHLEKNGMLSVGQKLHATWIEENQLIALEDLLYQNARQLQNFDSDTLVTLFLVAQYSGFPVKRYLAKYSWVPQRCRKEVLALLEELRQMQE
jgi:hypothetical protein